MLTAIRSDSQKTLAQDANKIDAPFTCPECNKNVILRKGLIKTPHFAHKPPVTCQYGQGESEEHRKCKQAIFNCLVEAGDSQQSGQFFTRVVARKAIQGLKYSQIQKRTAPWIAYRIF